jgi:hypothetical protein
MQGGAQPGLAGMPLATLVAFRRRQYNLTLDMLHKNLTGQIVIETQGAAILLAAARLVDPHAVLSASCVAAPLSCKRHCGASRNVGGALCTALLPRAGAHLPAKLLNGARVHVHLQHEGRLAQASALCSRAAARRLTSAEHSAVKRRGRRAPRNRRAARNLDRRASGASVHMTIV